MSEIKAAKLLRLMNWEKVKGDLAAILHTYDEEDYKEMEQYQKLYQEVYAFIDKVEDNNILE